MTEDTAGRPRGRPRDPGRDAAILRAAAELFAESGGMNVALTAVARRAGVSTATLYRRWPSKEALVLDSVHALLGEYEQPDLGDVQAEVLAFLTHRHETMAHPLFLATIPIIFGETCRQTPIGDRFFSEALRPLQQAAVAIQDRAVARGEFPAPIDSDVFVDLLVGPVLRRLLHTGRPVSPEFLEQVARTVVRGLATGPA